MHSPDAGLVEIVREFLAAHELLGRLFGRLRSGELRFEELQELVGDSEDAVLFRLKERCHALFRPGMRAADLAMTRGALFDLAVGSLFHEAMKLRENFYQLAVYAPKVEALRVQAAPDAERLFQEFERIIAAARLRLEEALQALADVCCPALAGPCSRYAAVLTDHDTEPRLHIRSRTRLSHSSTRSFQPAGTSVVELYSSSTQGPDNWLPGFNLWRR